MSPQSKLPVEENGGLSVAQIDLRIKDNNEALAKVWAKTMDEYTEKIDARFALHEEKDALRVEKHDLVINGRLDKQDEKLELILKEVKAGRAQGDEWHQADLEYRGSIQTWRETQEPKIEAIASKVEAVVTAQEDINTKFNLIQWFVLLCKGFVRGSDATIAVAEKGKKLTTALASIFSGLVFLWSFFKPEGILEYIKLWLHHHAH